MSKMRLFLLAEFETIFYDEEPDILANYLKGISKSILLKLASFLLDIHPKASKYSDWREVLKMWFGEEK